MAKAAEGLHGVGTRSVELVTRRPPGTHRISGETCHFWFQGLGEDIVNALTQWA